MLVIQPSSTSDDLDDTPTFGTSAIEQQQAQASQLDQDIFEPDMERARQSQQLAQENARYRAQRQQIAAKNATRVPLDPSHDDSNTKGMPSADAIVRMRRKDVYGADEEWSERMERAMEYRRQRQEEKDRKEGKEGKT